VLGFHPAAAREGSELAARDEAGYHGTVVQRASFQSPRQRPRYLGPPAPLLFPEEAEVPETQVHFELRVLARYQSMGVRELVRFDPEARPGQPMLRIWDRVDDSLLERDLATGPFQSSVLDVRWIVAGADDHAAALRITQSLDSDALVLTRRKARQAAERRVLELEAELRRRS